MSTSEKTESAVDTIKSKQSRSLLQSTGLVGIMTLLSRVFGLIRDIAKVFCHNRSETKILAASIRDAATVGRAFAAGAHICTIPPKVFDDMFKHVLTDKGLFQFMLDSGQIS